MSEYNLLERAVSPASNRPHRQQGSRIYGHTSEASEHCNALCSTISRIRLLSRVKSSSRWLPAVRWHLGRTYMPSYNTVCHEHL